METYGCQGQTEVSRLGLGRCRAAEKHPREGRGLGILVGAWRGIFLGISQWGRRLEGAVARQRLIQTEALLGRGWASSSLGPEV